MNAKGSGKGGANAAGGGGGGSGAGEGGNGGLAGLVNDEEARRNKGGAAGGVSASGGGSGPAAAGSTGAARGQQRRSGPSGANSGTKQGGGQHLPPDSARVEECREAIAPILIASASSDWRERHQAVTTLADLLMLDFPAEVSSQVGLLTQTFDVMSQRLTDSNSKCQLHALQTLNNVIPALCSGSTVVAAAEGGSAGISHAPMSPTSSGSSGARMVLQPVLSLFVPAMAKCLASSNGTVRTNATTLFSTLNGHVDHPSLIQLFVNICNQERPGVKAVMLEQIAELVPSVNGKKPTLLTRHVVPLSFRLLDETKQEARAANTRLIVKLHEVIGPTVFMEQCSALSQANKAKVIEFVGAANGKSRTI